MTNGAEQRRWRDGSFGDVALVVASTLERIRHAPPLPGAVLLLLLASATVVPVLLTQGGRI